MNLKTMNKKYRSVFSYSIFSLFVIVFFLSFVNGATFKQWESVDIRHPIRLDGAVNPAILANITIRNPDNDVLISFAPMNFDVATQEHNYTLIASNTGELGVYSYDITSTGNGQNDTSSFTFEVTPSGDKGLVGYFFLIIILSYGVLGLGIYKSDITISMLGTFALFFVGIWILYFGIDVFKNYLTEGFAILTLGVASYVSVRAAHEYITD